MQSRRKISFLLLLIIGVVLGIVIKNIKIGMISALRLVCSQEALEVKKNNV